MEVREALLSPTGVSIAVAVIAFLASALGAWLSYRAARQAERGARDAVSSKVDAEAYERARASYDAALREQEARIERLRAEADLLRTDQAALATRQQVMSGWARGLLRDLRLHDVQYPPPPYEDMNGGSHESTTET